MYLMDGTSFQKYFIILWVKVFRNVECYHEVGVNNSLNF